MNIQPSTPLQLKKNSILSIASTAAALLVFGIGLLQADEMTFNPTADTTVVQNPSISTNTYQNWGGSTLLSASITGTDANSGAYSLLRFDLSTLPGAATITDVQLTLGAGGGNYSYTRGEILHVWQVVESNQDWVEGSSNIAIGNGATGAYLNQTSYTSTAVNSGTNWASGGIFNVGAGDLSTEAGTLSLGGTTVSIGDVLSIDIDNSVIESWISNSNLATAGLAFHLTNDGSNTGTTFSFFNSMESGAASNLLPQLVITYVPEPSSAALILLGGLGILARRPTRRGPLG